MDSLLNLLKTKFVINIMGSKILIDEIDDENHINREIPTGHLNISKMSKHDSKYEFHSDTIDEIIAEPMSISQKYNIPDYFNESMQKVQRIFHANGNVLSTAEISKLLHLFDQSIFTNLIVCLILRQLNITSNPLDELFGLEWESCLIPCNLDYSTSRASQLQMVEVADEDSFYTSNDDETCWNFKEFIFTMIWMHINKSDFYMESNNRVSLRILCLLFGSIYDHYEHFIFPIFGDCREYYVSYCCQKTFFELNNFKQTVKQRDLNKVLDQVDLVSNKDEFLNNPNWYGFLIFHDLFSDFKVFNVPWNVPYHYDLGINEATKNRVFNGAAFLNSHEPSLPFEEYCWFVFSFDFNHPTAQNYWFNIFDLDCDDILSLYELDQISDKPLNRSNFLDYANGTFIRRKHLDRKIIEEVLYIHPAEDDQDDTMSG
eukprot:NODE_206_length_14836_cov_0.232408.p3 type:complete len:430 gc:universal NODE_206_length_14836_cov_0.232408:3505-2216(-)